MNRFLGSRLRPFDYVAVLFSIAVSVLATVLVYGPGSASTGAKQVVVEGSGRSWIFPLTAEERVVVPGPIGDTIVEIHDGHARVVKSPCDNQICVAAGEIHSAGQWIACLPNAVFVRIEGKSDDEGPDASTW